MAQPLTKVAVEFDGLTHYLAGASSRGVLDGKSKAKERLLRSLGWDVVRVSYFEWYALGSSADRDKYLRDKIPES
jgi:very-short-patch-repair endonuclease